MAAASPSNAPDGGESASDAESICSDDAHSAVSSSGLDSDEEFGVGCESREASESDASETKVYHSAADESADGVADDEADAADELSPEVSECQRCRRCRGSVEAVSRQCRLTLVSMVSRCVDPCRPVSTRVRGRIDSLYARHMS